MPPQTCRQHITGSNWPIKPLPPTNQSTGFQHSSIKFCTPYMVNFMTDGYWQSITVCLASLIPWQPGMCSDKVSHVCLLMKGHTINSLSAERLQYNYETHSMYITNTCRCSWVACWFRHRGSLHPQLKLQILFRSTDTTQVSWLQGPLDTGLTTFFFSEAPI